MAQPKVGLQLIVYGRRPGEDLEGVLKEVAGAGYVGIEAGNLYAMAGEDVVEDILAETGLEVAGMHSGYNETTNTAKVEANLEYLQTVGAGYLINSGVAPGEGLEAYEAAAETFNRVGQSCLDAGIVFAYHNHNWEFKEFDGVKGMHRLCELTDPELVKLCVDVYWVHIGGEDPAEFIARYSDRAEYFHVKDGSPGKFIELGEGEVDLKSALAAARKQNPEWIVCEQDRSDLEPKESITRSMAYLKTIGL